MVTTPTRRKKRLGRLLERLRGAAGRSLVDAAELLRVKDSSVSRYETGQVRPGWAALQALLSYYEAKEADRAEAAMLWQDAGGRPAGVLMPVGSSRPLREFLRAEEEADSERTLALQAVPGLLQTPGYVRALVASEGPFGTARTTPERQVAARLSRQVRLGGAAPIQLHAVLDEAVVRRVVGGPEVMAEQLRHLLAAGRGDGVTVQVVAFEAGGHGAMSSGFSIVGYDDEDPNLVFVDHLAGGSMVEKEDEVARYEDVFAEIARLALSPARSANLIRSRLRELQRMTAGPRKSS